MYVTITNLTISLPLLGNKPKKFDFVHQTVSHQEARASWPRDCNISPLTACQWEEPEHEVPSVLSFLEQLSLVPKTAWEAGTAEGLIVVNSHLCSVQSTLYGSQRLGVSVIILYSWPQPLNYQPHAAGPAYSAAPSIDSMRLLQAHTHTLSFPACSIWGM